MKDYFANLSQQYELESGGSENKPTPMPIPIPMSPEGAVAMQVVDIAKEIIRCFTDYSKCKEHEVTERKRILATLKALEYQIDARKEVCLKAMEYQYAERDRMYKSGEFAMQAAVNKAVKNNDTEMLKLIYNFMLNVYNGSVQLNSIGNMFGKIDLF